MASSTVLAAFHPLVQKWFAQRFAQPTDAQLQAWPRIAAGEHVLLTAPTGSGKTLTAFLWAIDALLTQRYAAGCTRVLYVSPRKALNTDIRINLEEPLAALQAAFTAADIGLPPLRARTRSGDTSASERAQLLRNPPEILITTPESLNLMLTSPRGRAALGDVQAVIIDEVHELIGDRRGVQLITALERMAHSNGEFQRIALSATVRPLDVVARWIGGRQLIGAPRAASYRARPVCELTAADRKQLRLQVQFPAAAVGADVRGERIWQPIAKALRASIEEHAATLIFANSRRLAEHLAQQINDGTEPPMIYAHHGSLARPLRAAVEQRLKSGQLRAIVATSSLEMGIDIGSIDRVVLIQTPPSIASTIQRTGRAGHQVGATSQGVLIPSHGRDFIRAAALATAVDARAIEPVQPVLAPLDMLAQQILSCCTETSWQLDDLFAVLRCAAPYAELARAQFESVVDMLAGRFEGARLRGLSARLSVDRGTRIARTLRAGVLALYRAGGSIPDRGYYALRQFDSNAQIGELDEEFVWEAKIGQVFSLGARNWRIHRITHDDVLVEPTHAASGTPPFWISEGMNRNHHFALRIADTLQEFETVLQAPNGSAALRARLQQTHHFDAIAANELSEFLARQRAHTGCALPHRRLLLIERVHTGAGGYAPQEQDEQLLLHTLWGGRVNRPLALALAAAFALRYGYAPEVHVADDVIALQTKGDCTADALLDLLLSADIGAMLGASLAASAFFGARFRECAGRALLLVPRQFKRRQPLWMTRQNAKELLHGLEALPDFPIVLETWRSCLQDEFDLPALHARLAELRSGAIGWTSCRSATPSPFAGDLAFNQISRYMYADDTPIGQRPSTLDESLLAEYAAQQAGSSHAEGSAGPHALGMQIDPALIAAYLRRRQRLEPGWLPADGHELIEWLRERIALAPTDAAALFRALVASHGESAVAALQFAADRVCVLRFADTRDFLCSRDRAAELLHLNANDVRACVWKAPSSADALAGSRLDDCIGSTLELSPLDDRSLDADTMCLELLAFQPPRLRAELVLALPLDASAAEAVLTRLLAHGALLERRWLAASTSSSALIDHAPDPRQLQVDVAGVPAAPGDELLLCTPDTLHGLLRLQRGARRAEARIATLPLHRLPVFLATWQRFDGDLDSALASLSGFSAPAAAWESELLPARVLDYTAHELDARLREGDCTWRGTGEGQLALTLTEDLQCLTPATNTGIAIEFADNDARYDYFALLDRQLLPSPAFSRQLWSELWSGVLGSDDFAVIRAGIARGFELPAGAGNVSRDAPTRRDHASRRIAARQRARGWPGLFHRLEYVSAGTAAAPADPLLALERAKACARLLLARYGIVNRELASREQLACGWSAIFRALRLLELGGEVVAGQFFAELSMPQFATPAAAARLAAHRPDSDDAAIGDGTQQQQHTPRRAELGLTDFWCAASDPISPCGLGATWPLPLPRRSPGNLLVFAGGSLVAILEGRGRRLQATPEFTFACTDSGGSPVARQPASHPTHGVHSSTEASSPSPRASSPSPRALLSALTHLLQRASADGERFTVESIDGAPAATSPWSRWLRAQFEVSADHLGHLQLGRHF